MFKVAASTFRFTLGAICLFCLQNYAESVEYNIPVEKSYTITLPANVTSTIQTGGLDIEGARFVVIQIHSQRKTLILSSTKTFNVDFTKEGTNIGLVTLLKVNQDKATWYVKTNSSCNVTASVIVQLYTYDSPIPGGCNQVFNLELDQSVVVDHGRPYRAHIFFQWANQATPQREDLPKCENSQIIANLEYEVYVYFMQGRDLSEVSFLRAVQRMLRPEDVAAHGTKICSLTNGPTAKSQVSVTAREAQGAVYSILVRRKDTGHSATYTTIGAYACNIDAGECSLD
ncbi:hypothetical protein EGW08_018070, partial [Elysia chlorotica]